MHWLSLLSITSLSCRKITTFTPEDFSDSNLVPDGEASTLCDEPLAAADHLVGDLHQEGGHPLRRVVEA